MKIVLLIDESPSFFMRWFDCQMDQLVGNGEPLYYSPTGCAVSLLGLEFKGQGGSSLRWKPDPSCKYLEYRLHAPDYGLDETCFLKQLPLEVSLLAFRELDPEVALHKTQWEKPIRHFWFTEIFLHRLEPLSSQPPHETVPGAMAIELRWSQPQAKLELKITYQLYETDPLLWLLRAVTDEYEDAREKLDRKVLAELISRASEAEWAEWEKLDWVSRSEEDLDVTQRVAQSGVISVDTSSEEPTEEPKERYVFRRRGDYGEVAYGGGEVQYIKGLKGMHYLSILLAYPNKGYDVLELVQVVERNIPDSATPLGEDIDAGSAVDRDDGYDIIDDGAKKDYRRRLAENAEERKQAETDGDMEKIDSLDHELKYIEDQLSSSTGLGGRRRSFSTDHEKARTNVQKAIKLAEEKIREQLPELADYLVAKIETGGSCSYAVAPEKPLDWEL